jgi:hypothetical protein
MVGTVMVMMMMMMTTTTMTEMNKKIRLLSSTS